MIRYEPSFYYIAFTFDSMVFYKKRSSQRKGRIKRAIATTFPVEVTLNDFHLHGVVRYWIKLDTRQRSRHESLRVITSRGTNPAPLFYMFASKFTLTLRDTTVGHALQI